MQKRTLSGVRPMAQQLENMTPDLGQETIVDVVLPNLRFLAYQDRFYQRSKQEVVKVVPLCKKMKNKWRSPFHLKNKCSYGSRQLGEENVGSQMMDPID